ncbi:MAG: nucleoside triphosphate pyrophosphohydrolase [Lentisphaeria bacterium]|nr:nucleoside triphosphate pyrophosphohydrolase [Lentisphaeria bacterium]
MMQYEPTAEGLLKILEKLRAPDGCPWDREQTRQTLSRHLAGEVAELLEAIDRNEPAAICDELGDVMMNVLFQAIVAAEQQEFTAEDVFRNINDKMVRRHAHIFGDAKAETAEDVAKIWQEVKKKERGTAEENPSILGKLPQTLSALTRAEDIQKKVAKAGFDWQDQYGIIDKIREELDEVSSALAEGDETHVDEEIGDLLFAVSNLTRFRKRATAEELLRAANRKFISRFQKVENMLAERGIPVEQAGITLLEELWQQAKQ